MVIAAVGAGHHMRPCPLSSGSEELRPDGERRRGVRSGVGAREADRAAPVCGGGAEELRRIAVGCGQWTSRGVAGMRGRDALATGHGVARCFGRRPRASARWARSRQSSNAPTVVPTTRDLLGSRNERREGSQALGGRADRALGGLGQTGRVWTRSGCRSPVSSTDDIPWPCDEPTESRLRSTRYCSIVARMDELGRAHAGSQLQTQIYVNRRRAALDAATVHAAPDLAEARFDWVSPLESDWFTEYRDGAALDRLGLGHHRNALREFWPSGGPRWDALARVELPTATGVLLVEAKSYVGELHGPGCLASSDRSRTKIASALDATKHCLGVPAQADWLGALYQSANRIAHLHFLRSLGVPAWLLSLCFVADPRSPTSVAEWELGLASVRQRLGFGDRWPDHVVEVFIPGAEREVLLKEGID